MKNLILLLTSLLLAGAASATVLDFERVETHQDTSIDLNQDFQVAHPCGIGRKHIGRHDGGALQGFNINVHTTTHRAQCAKWEWIRNCVSQNRPVNLYKGGECQSVCPAGSVVDTTDDYKNVGSCRVDKTTCASIGFGFIPEGNGLCVHYSPEYCKEHEGGRIYNPGTRKCEEECPSDHSWQEQHKKCVSNKELFAYCFKTHNKAFDKYTASCKECPLGTYLQQSGCLSKQQLDIYCIEQGKGFYEPDINACRDRCPANHSWQKAQKECVSVTVLEKHCNDRDEIYVAERNRCERCAKWHPIRVGNTCNACPDNHSWQAIHKKCVSFAELNSFCSTQGNKIYNPATDACEEGCPDNRPKLVDGVCKTISEYTRINMQACSEQGLFFDLDADACHTLEQKITTCNAYDMIFSAEHGYCLRCFVGGQSRVGNACVCPDGKGFNATTNKCEQCAEGSRLSNNTCVVDAVSCATLNKEFRNGACHACSERSVFDTNTNRCKECKFRRVPINGVCALTEEVKAMQIEECNRLSDMSTLINGECWATAEVQEILCPNAESDPDLYEFREACAGFVRTGPNNQCPLGSMAVGNWCWELEKLKSICSHQVLDSRYEKHCRVFNAPSLRTCHNKGQIFRDNACHACVGTATFNKDTNECELSLADKKAECYKQNKTYIPGSEDCYPVACVEGRYATGNGCLPRDQLNDNICPQEIIMKGNGAEIACSRIAAENQERRSAVSVTVTPPAPPPAATESSCASQGKGFNFIAKECVTCEEGYAAYNGNCMASERACKSVGKVFNNRASICEEPPSVASCAAANGKLYHAVRKQCYVCVDDIDGDGKTVRLDGRCHTPEEVRGVCADPESVARLDIADFCVYFTPSEEDN